MKVAGLGLAVALALATSGCSVPIGSEIGLTRDADGAVVAVIAVCEGYLDGITVYSGEGDRTTDRGVWVHQGKLKHGTRLVLGKPDASWTTELPWTPPSGQAVYSLMGWTKDNEWSAGGPDFTAGDLAALREGEIWLVPFDESVDDFRPRFLTPREFEARCDDQ